MFATIVFDFSFDQIIDLKMGFPADVPAMPPLPRPNTGALPGRTTEGSTPQVARVMRAVTEEKEEEKESTTASHLE
jgi:hypothetical protein